MASRREIPRELSIYINDVAVVNSLRGITSEITRTNNEMRNLNRNSATYDEDLQRLGGNLSQLRDRQSEFREEINATTQASNNAAGSFAKFRDGLLSGNLTTAREGLLGIKAEMTGLVRSSLAFIATPLGVTIAVLAGFVAGAKYLFDFNKELEVSNKTLRALGVSAQDLSKVRSEIQATAETFDKEFDVIAEKANSLSKTYKISMSEANAFIARGLADGGAQNDEFLDSIGEYDEFFSKAGYSAQEFIGIINKGFDLGIYSDKLPDALKEADLALKEQTQSTRDALENAFGAAFSDTLLAKVASGTISTKQALEQIATQAQKTGLTQQQQAQLTADVFKGAGEDAGGALKILEVVSQSAQKELSATAKAQLTLLDANERLNKAQAELFEIEGFSGIWDAIKASGVNALSDILDWVIDVKKDIQPLIDFVGVTFVGAWELLKTVTSAAFSLIGGGLKLVSNTFATVFGIIKKIITLDFMGAIDVFKNGFTNMGAIVSNTFGGIKNTILTTLQNLVTTASPILSALGVDVDVLQKKLESFKSKEVVLKTTTTSESKGSGSNKEASPEETAALQKALADRQAIRDTARQKEEAARQKAADKKKADEEKAAKEELDKVVALQKAKSDVAKSELALYIATQRSKLDSTKALSPDIIQEETNRLDAIKDRQLTALAEQRLANVEKAQTDAKSAEEFALLKQTIDYDYELKRQELELGFQQSTDALKKEYLEEQKVLKAEQLEAENELAVEEAETKEEENAIKREQEYAKQLVEYKKLFDNKIITEKQYEDFKVAAQKKQDEMDRVAELQKLQGTLGGLNQLAGAVTDLFGQSREMAIVQAGINGALAVTSILAQYPKFDGGFAMYAAIAAAGISTIAQVGKISKSKAVKTPQFFYGGNTGNKAALGYDEYGPVTGYVHKNEYVIPEVMTQSPRFANTIAWLEQERTGRAKPFFNGGETSPGVVPTDTAITESDSQMKSLLGMLLFRLENPIAPSLNIGYTEAKSIEDLNSERAASSNNAIINQ